MISAAIAERFGLIAIKPCDHHDFVAERLQRLQNGRKLEFRSITLWEPLVVNNSVGMIDNPESPHWFRRRVLSGAQRRHHRIQQGQSDSGSDSAKHGPPRNSFLGDDVWLIAAGCARIRSGHY